MILIACILPAFTVCRRLPECDGEWVSFTSPQRDFAIVVPRHLSAVPETNNPPPGNVPRIRFQLLAADNPCKIYFGVERIDFPERTVSLEPSLALDGARNTAVSSAHGQLIAEAPIGLEDNPGREIRISSGQKALATQRMYIVGDHLYVIFAVEQDTDRTNPSVLRFLNSFQLRGKGAL